jgi:hypothetical protein
MEWTCARCGQMAEVATWLSLTELGWRLDEIGDCLCHTCTARQWPQTGRSLGGPRRDVPVAPRAERPTGLPVPPIDGLSSPGAAACRLPPARPRLHLTLVK